MDHAQDLCCHVLCCCFTGIGLVGELAAGVTVSGDKGTVEA
jgi:hypothetical protein